jgi:hypothetical protein
MSENQNSDSGNSTYGGNTTTTSDNTGTTRTWSDSTGSVTTDPTTGNINWSSGGAGQPAGDYTESTGQSTGTYSPAAGTDQFARLKELSDMFNAKNPEFAQAQAQLPGVTDSLSQLTNSSPDVMGVTDLSPTDRASLAKLGVTSYSQLGQYAKDSGQNLSGILGHEVDNSGLHSLATAGYGSLYGANPNNLTGQSVDHMIAAGNVSDGIGMLGKALVSAAMPPIARLGLAGYNAYKGYQADPNRDIGKAIATGASALPGYAGALANMYNGNYGAAVTGGLAKNGITGPTASLAGIGADFASGKNVAPSLGGLAGQFAGQSIGGPLGGMFGRSLGQQMSRSSSLRK